MAQEIQRNSGLNMPPGRIETGKFMVMQIVDYKGDKKIWVERNSGEQAGEGTELTVEEFDSVLTLFIEEM